MVGGIDHGFATLSGRQSLDVAPSQPRRGPAAGRFGTVGPGVARLDLPSVSPLSFHPVAPDDPWQGMTYPYELPYSPHRIFFAVQRIGSLV